MSTRQLSLAAIAGLLATMAACGTEATPQPPPYPDPVTNPNQSTQCPAECPDSCSAAGECYTTTASQCPAECPDDCDSFGQCNYTLDPNARYRVDLLQASVTESGSRACSLTGMLGWARATCDLYVVFRTSTSEVQSPVSRESNVVFGGVTIPDATFGDLEQSFEVRVMDENYEGTDTMIAACRPDWTKEALEVGSVTIQCGAFGSGGDDPYAGSSLAVVKIKLTALDGGAVQPVDGTTTSGNGGA